MAIHDHLETALAVAVRVMGSQSAFARLVSRDQSTVHDWLKSGRLLPAEHVFDVEAATGVSRHDLRPDIYPIEQAPVPGIRPGGAPAVEDNTLTAGALNPIEGLQ